MLQTIATLARSKYCTAWCQSHVCEQLTQSYYLNAETTNSPSRNFHYTGAVAANLLLVHHYA